MIRIRPSDSLRFGSGHQIWIRAMDFPWYKLVPQIACDTDRKVQNDHVSNFIQLWSSLRFCIGKTLQSPSRFSLNYTTCCIEIIRTPPLISIWKIISMEQTSGTIQSSSIQCWYWVGIVAGPEVPDDRNMLNENLWSPDRPKFRGRLHKGRFWNTWIYFNYINCMLFIS